MSYLHSFDVSYDDDVVDNSIIVGHDTYEYNKATALGDPYGCNSENNSECDSYRSEHFDLSSQFRLHADNMLTSTLLDEAEVLPQDGSTIDDDIILKISKIESNISSFVNATLNDLRELKKSAKMTQRKRSVEPQLSFRVHSLSPDLRGEEETVRTISKKRPMDLEPTYQVSNPGNNFV